MQLLFIDSAVQQPEYLTQDLTPESHPNLHSFIISPQANFIAEVTQILTKYSQVNAIHFVFHGEDHTLQLGQINLTPKTLETYAPLLKQWHKFLTADADILLYGCNVAKTPKGQELVHQFSQLTQTNIAASTHLTGNAELGGSWDLDYKTKPVKTPIVFNQKIQESYPFVLATFDVNQPTDDGTGNLPGTLSWAIQQANETAGDDTINFNTSVRLNLDPSLKRIQPLIDSNINFIGNNKTISGDNDNDGVIDLNGEDRPLFFINSGVVSFEDLILTGGVAKGGNSLFGGGGAGLGGGLFINSGDVTLDNVTFEENYAIGGDVNSGGYAGGGLSGDNINFTGGGLFTDGPAENGSGLGENGDFGEGGRLGNGIAAGNGGFGGGGGYGHNANGGNGGFGGGGGFGSNANGGDGGFGAGGGRGSITPGQGGFGAGDGGEFAGGGGAGLGGALFIREGSLTIQNSTFSKNSAQGGEGRDGSEAGQGLGGAIFVPDDTTNLPNLPTLLLSNVTFSDNTASNDTNSESNNDNIYGVFTEPVIENPVPENQPPTFVNRLNLYDNFEVTPDDSTATTNGSWLAFGNLFPGSVTPTANGNFTTLDSTSELDLFAGYSNYNLMSDDLVNTAFPTLDPDTGYTLSFAAQVISEDNIDSDKNADGKSDRAGFNVTVISSDGKNGIELGFENDQIWAQEDGTTQDDPSAEPNPNEPNTFDRTLFTQAESVIFDTTNRLVQYDLTILGETYTLSVDGNSILSGQLRDYTAFNDRPDPYELPNFIFLGDHTTSAQAKVQLGEISVTTAANDTDYSFELVENAANGLVIGQVSATDPDGDNLTYNITTGNDSGIFAINSDTGEISLANNNSLDFDTEPTAYSLTVEVSDGSLTDTIDVAVNLTNVNEVPDNSGGETDGETPENPDNQTPEVPDNSGGETDGETPENPDNQTPEVPDNSGGETDGETPENPDNQTPEVPDNSGGETDGETPENPETAENPDPEENPDSETPDNSNSEDNKNSDNSGSENGNNGNTNNPIRGGIDTQNPGNLNSNPGNSDTGNNNNTPENNNETDQETAIPRIENFDPSLNYDPTDFISLINFPSLKPNLIRNERSREATSQGDNLEATSENQKVFGLEGDDNIYGTSASLEIFGNMGNDYIEGQASSETIYGGENNDQIKGENGNDTLFGDKDNDIITGENGDDVIYGNTGNDTLEGAQGNDSLYSGQDNDLAKGGVGNDLVFGDIGDDIVEGNEGNDTLHGNQGVDTISGNDGDDLIYGGQGSDLLDGNNGSDTLFGDNGDDTLDGGFGDDTLIGGNGDDWLVGASGNDTLTGGEGRDRFYISTNFDRNLITDFDDGLDKIALTGGLTFDQLEITSDNGSTLIKLADTQTELATLLGVDSNAITSDDFLIG
ncbi:hemolysin-type calcium-binding repeat family protein [Lyngbya aestuarii BL J]|uniref:Hemolysin-type calcium-binding repeat family protein n=4 Tax=Lyngbya aestuarii TaxID=118322 RepID=U7QC86_9CYAN|nr:hemolysin-type calcium-binding repeat family protein [Lyngbya aestuarii BL J]